ncbi:unnamed protein product [Rangifer tarandus platyrhynchus]|uniref:Uncharacterized protein n=2 Tax=Rangifer tarandus platyrhynchus TaxID=3082113 RepID=A0ACB0EPF9_RANTA|nr:unnamed protein product [Rangifer tarandus platyrhynchus]CAI9702565.1 unnamed protein product [Rangifer tarandus platyrhynchus]
MTSFSREQAAPVRTRRPPSPSREAPPPVNQLISRPAELLAPDADRGAAGGESGERARGPAWPVASEG